MNHSKASAQAQLPWPLRRGSVSRQAPGLRYVSYTNPPRLALGLLNHILSQECLFAQQSVAQTLLCDPANLFCPGNQEDSPATIK